LGFFSRDGRRRTQREKTEDKTKTKQKDTNNTIKKKRKQNKTKQTDRNISSIIFVYAHISIKDVRVEKILPREERRAGSRARATARLSLGE
jgi:hypothetical protein